MSSELIPFIVRENKSISSMRQQHLPSIKQQQFMKKNVLKHQSTIGYDEMIQREIKLANIDRANKFVSYIFIIMKL